MPFVILIIIALAVVWYVGGAILAVPLSSIIMWLIAGLIGFGVGRMVR